MAGSAHRKPRRINRGSRLRATVAFSQEKLCCSPRSLGAAGSCLYRRHSWRLPFWVQTFQQLAVSIVPVGAIVLTGVAAGLVHWSPGLIAILAYNCVVTTALGYFLLGKVLSMCRQRGMPEWLARRPGGVKIQVHLSDQSHRQRRDAMTPITASSHLAPAGELRFRGRTAVALPPPKAQTTPSIMPKSPRRRPPRRQAPDCDRRFAATDPGWPGRRKKRSRQRASMSLQLGSRWNPYVDTCSRITRDCLMPNVLITNAGISEPGTSSHRNQPRWFGPHA